MNSKKKTASKRSAPKPLSAGTKPAPTKAAPQPVPATGPTGAEAVSKKPLSKPTAWERVSGPRASAVAASEVSSKSAATPVAPVVLPPPKPAPLPKKLPDHLKVPDILLEDDTLPPDLAVRFVPPPPPAPEPEPEPVVAATEPPPAPTLPPHYGTRELSLVARDPFTLFAAWDFSAGEIVAAQQASASGQVLLRIFRGETLGPMVVELPVDPARRHAFIPTPVSGTAYRAVIGLVTQEHAWHELAGSAVAFTPPEAAPVVPETVVPAEPPTARIALVSPPIAAPVEAMLPAWIRALPPAQSVPAFETVPSFPEWHPPTVTATWSPVLSGASERLVGRGGPPGGPGAFPGSASVPTGGPSSLDVGLSSPAAVPAAPDAGRDFWFKVNAEVVLYGSTERDAKVTVAGRPVRLRSDGSFSFRFSLPDGSFTLPVKAAAADGYSPREAIFHLGKTTERRGRIGEHPQDAGLRPPLADNAIPE